MQSVAYGQIGVVVRQVSGRVTQSGEARLGKH